MARKTTQSSRRKPTASDGVKDEVKTPAGTDAVSQAETTAPAENGADDAPQTAGVTATDVKIEVDGKEIALGDATVVIDGDEGEDEGSIDAELLITEGPFVRVSTLQGRPRRRAGMRFTREGITLDASKLTEAQRDAINDDPLLKVAPVAREAED